MNTLFKLKLLFFLNSIINYLGILVGFNGIQQAQWSAALKTFTLTKKRGKILLIIDH